MIIKEVVIGIKIHLSFCFLVKSEIKNRILNIIYVGIVTIIANGFKPMNAVTIINTLIALIIFLFSIFSFNIF